MLVRSLFALSLLGTLACGTTEVKEDKKPTEPAMAEVIDYQAMVALYNAGEYEGAMAMFSDEVKATSSGETGKDALMKRWEESKALAPQVAVSRILEQDGMWVAQGVMHGTHSADYHGAPATNKPFAVDYLHVGWTNDKGETKELLSLLNSMAIAAQLGMMPMPAAMAEVPTGETEIVSGAGDAKNIATAKAVYDAYNAGEFETLKQYIAEDAKVNMRAHHKTYAGLPAIEKAMSSERNGFSERTSEVKSVAIGDYVVVVGEVTAKHTGQLGPTPPTGKTVNWHFADVLKFKDGKLVEGDFYYNPGAVARQLGMGRPGGHGAPGGEHGGEHGAMDKAPDAPAGEG